MSTDTKILVSDAVDMILHKIKVNTPPFQASAMKKDNLLVQQWAKQVLEKFMDDDGRVDADMVADSWEWFYRGCTTVPVMKFIEKGLVELPSEKVVDHWRDWLANATVEEMHNEGVITVSEALNACQTFYRHWYIQKAYDLCYSQSDDPYQWELMRPKFKEISRGNGYQLWSREVHENVLEKCNAVLRTHATVEGVAGVKKV